MNTKLHKFAKLLVSEYNKLVDSMKSDELSGIQNFEEFIPSLEGVRPDTLEDLMTSAYGRAFLTGYLMGYPGDEVVILTEEEFFDATEGDNDKKKITH